MGPALRCPSAVRRGKTTLACGGEGVLAKPGVCLQPRAAETANGKQAEQKQLPGGKGRSRRSRLPLGSLPLAFPSSRVPPRPFALGSTGALRFLVDEPAAELGDDRPEVDRSSRRPQLEVADGSRRRTRQPSTVRVPVGHPELDQIAQNVYRTARVRPRDPHLDEGIREAGGEPLVAGMGAGHGPHPRPLVGFVGRELGEVPDG